MPIQKKYNIIHKLTLLAEGDVAFEKELIQLYTHSFQELKNKFRTIIISGDLKELSFINHKYRTTFIMFDLQNLAYELQKSKEIVESGRIHALELNEIITKVEEYCTEILNELFEAQ